MRSLNCQSLLFDLIFRPARGLHVWSIKLRFPWAPYSFALTEAESGTLLFTRAYLDGGLTDLGRGKRLGRAAGKKKHG